ncbi:MAG: beta-L-arabinofuranosidase domain-containing protein [Fimbriimonas sp.]
MIPILALLAMATPQAAVKVFDALPGGTNDFYVGNQAPLLPSAFRKLPIGAVTPAGWMRKQLELQAEGFSGRLPEISKWLKKENNAWLSPTGVGENGWEEVPYWLKGFGDLGYLLSDQRIIGEAKVWIEGVLASQRKDGYFGPQSNKVANKGAADVWPNMVMLNALQTYYEYSGDPRVLDLMSRYFKWQATIPDKQMFLSYWEKHRAGDNIGSIYWLYNRTGDHSLLKLVEKMHTNAANWVAGVPDWHGVNIAQAFREPAQYAMLSKDKRDMAATEQDYQTVRKLYGQVPGGLFGADENARPGFDDPRQASETCTMVEMMLSDEMLLTMTGERKWAERCEDVAFNSLPASMTPDLKALRYLTSPNMAVSDASSKAPGLQNGGPMLLMDPNDHRCCQHNVSHGWPYFAEHLWLASNGNGLAVGMYAPSAVSAKVGVGDEIKIVEETHYPLNDRVIFRFVNGEGKFPLLLRLPSWCKSPKLNLNGTRLPIKGKGAWVQIDRHWNTGDLLVLSLPMEVEVKKWPKHGNAVSINRGPLSYSLKIDEKVVRKGGTDQWPAYEIRPTSPWNYAIDPASIRVVTPTEDVPQPWSSQGQISLKAKARRVPEWQLDMHGLVSPLQQSPAHTTAPLEEVTLIPMGAARLRISVFPTFSTTGGTKWKAPQMPKPSWPATASHKFYADSLNALSDGLLPKSSSDQLIPRFTWWDHKGTTEWVQYNLPTSVTAGTAEVYWFDDSKLKGGCRVPASWRLQYMDNGTWRDVAVQGPYGTAKDKLNQVRFTPVTASQWRIETTLQPGYSSGILEWVLR